MSMVGLLSLCPIKGTCVLNKEEMRQMDKYYEKYGELYCKQLELEISYKTEAEAILKASLEKAIADGEAAATKIGGKLIDLAFDTTKANICAVVAAVKHPKRGVVPLYAPVLKHLLLIYRDREDDLYNLLTLATLSNVISNTFLGRTTISGLAAGIVNEIEREAKVEAYFLYKGAQEGQIDPRLIKNFDEGIKKRVGMSFKTSYATIRMNRDGFEWTNWERKAKQALGAKLLEMAIKGSGFFEESIDSAGIACVSPKPWLSATWERNAALLSKYSYKFCPMVIPPKPWESPYEGGYYGELSKFVSLLRLHSGQGDSAFVKEYKKRLNHVDLSYIYKALNAMQDTPFTINKQVLEASEKILASGGGLGFPRTEPIPQLPWLTGEFTHDELKAHKKKMTNIIKQNQARASKALRATMSVSTAKKFAEYDKIYFPWNMDYRGRCYPVPSCLSPQGDDITKALLLFAEPNECKNKDDYRWLAIHGANMAGHDKITLDERIAWVKKHTKEILSSANDPLGYTWWYEESKNDYPLEFLAFCFEWQKLQEWLKTHKDCVGFKSGLPIAFDGSCSGLQHFSALLKDEIGGHAVNLVPSDQVQDIYSIVADKVNKTLLSDCVKGTNDEFKTDKAGNYVLTPTKEKIMKLGSKTLAQQWLIFARQKFGKDGITRKVVKRSVMTLAYGSKKYGFKMNILEDIIKPFALERPDDHPFTAKEQAAAYMADLTWKAVSKTVVKAVKGMDYLQAIAGLICKAGAVVTWTTPNGLPVQQNYFKMEQKEFKMRFNGVQKRFYTQENTFEIDKNAQKNAISPNFIHSLDACHLQRVVVASKERGNHNFAMIHDSFGTDMGKAGELFRIIREQFVELYDNTDHLQDFLSDVEYLLEEGTELPEKPSSGKLKVSDITKSNYCFA